MDAITALKNMAKAARRTGQDLAAAQIDLCIAEISKNPAMTQHTDEPSVDEMNNIADAMEVCGLSWEPRACLIGNVTAAQIVQVARALRSHLRDPTLSADRLAEIQKRHEADDAVLCAHEQARAAGADPGDYDISVSAHNDRAELLAAHRAERNAVIEECAKVADKYQETNNLISPAFSSGACYGARVISHEIRALKQ